MQYSVHQTNDQVNEQVNEQADGRNQMQENQVAQILAMLGKLITEVEGIKTRLDRVEARLDKIEVRLDAIEFRLDKIEVRLDAIEFRLDKIEVRLDAIELRLDKIEVRLDAIEFRLDDFGKRLVVIEVELPRLGALFEDNERTLAVILEVLSDHVKKSALLEVHDEQIIGQRQDLEITQSALSIHIQNKKIHLSPKPGRPKKPEPGLES